MEYSFISGTYCILCILCVHIQIIQYAFLKAKISGVVILVRAQNKIHLPVYIFYSAICPQNNLHRRKKQYSRQDRQNATAWHFCCSGGLNVRVGLDNVGCESCITCGGITERNGNRQQFSNLCLENGLVICSTIFQHETKHKLT